jgi:hypothetical protein
MNTSLLVGLRPRTRLAARRRVAAASRLIVLLAIVGPGLASWARPAYAWGRLGHRVSARLAESRLGPATRSAIGELMGPGETLADVATWADEQRRAMPWSGPWHYVNVPITEPRYDSRFEGEAGSIVAKIDEFRQVLADRSASLERRRLALRFLVHLVQDVHQPLHVGDRGDRGGNVLQVRFFGKGSNLHKVWDSGLLEHVSREEADWVFELGAAIDAEAAERWARVTSAADWAGESLALARVAYCEPGCATALRPGSSLGEVYQQANLPVVRERLAQSAVRLAALLDAIFEGDGHHD